jgi:hypothetical protein
MIQENQAKIDQLSSSYSAPEQLSCMFELRHDQFDSPSTNDSHGNHSSDGIKNAANEDRCYYSSKETAYPNTPKDQFFNHPANQRSTYHQNKLLLAKPMNWDYYPPYYSDDDDDDDDDDDHVSGNDNSLILRRKPFGTATTQHLPNLESSDDGDDEEESLDEGWMKRSGLQSQTNPSVVYYTSHWHPSPGYIYRHHHLLPYQQQMQSSLSSPATPYHFHQYHPISRHPSKTHPRNQLMRHYSYEDVPRNGFLPYRY